jgi:hypothetical protein
MRSLLLALTLVSTQSFSDWTVRLPTGAIESAAGRITTTAGTPFGIVLLLYGQDGSSLRLLWYTKDGKLKADYKPSDNSVFPRDRIYILNHFQILLATSTQPPLIRVLTVSDSARIDTRDFNFTSSQIPSFADFVTYGTWLNLLDTTGLYYVDKAAETLTRVDFQKPLALGEPLILNVQMSTNVFGPWNDVEELAVPNDSPKAFYRVQLNR